MTPSSLFGGFALLSSKLPGSLLQGEELGLDIYTPPKPEPAVRSALLCVSGHLLSRSIPLLRPALLCSAAPRPPAAASAVPGAPPAARRAPSAAHRPSVEDQRAGGGRPGGGQKSGTTRGGGNRSRSERRTFCGHARRHGWANESAKRHVGQDKEHVSPTSSQSVSMKGATPLCGATTGKRTGYVGAIPRICASGWGSHAKHTYIQGFSKLSLPLSPTISLSHIACTVKAMHKYQNASCSSQRTPYTTYSITLLFRDWDRNCPISMRIAQNRIIMTNKQIKATHDVVAANSS